MASQQPRETRKYKRTETWGAIRKLPSGRHQASYVHEGKRRTAPRPFDAVQDARSWLSGVRTDIQRGQWRDPESIRVEIFGPYAQAWLADRKSSKGEPLRPRTRAEYQRQLNGGLSEFANERLDKITPPRIRAWHTKRLAESGGTSAARETALLGAILSTAVEDELLTRNPVDSKLARSSSNLQHRPPTPEELRVIRNEFEANAPHLKLAILLAALGGLRMSEWRALVRSDITIIGEQVLVSVERQAQRITGLGWVVGEPKSAEGRRVVPLPLAISDDVRVHLATWVGPLPTSKIFAPKQKSEYLHDAQFNEHWNPARVAAGVRKEVDGVWVNEVREHDLRHYALSSYAEMGATQKEIMQRAGHSTSQASIRYQHIINDRSVQLANAMPVPWGDDEAVA